MVCFCSNREAETAATALILKGCKSVIITLGAQGALYLSKSEKIFVASPKVQSVDCTGAGDAFIGALAYLLCNFNPLGMEKILEMACSIAADSVTREGTQSSFPNKEILNKFVLK